MMTQESDIVNISYDAEIQMSVFIVSSGGGRDRSILLMVLWL
jgi:hypothetical protein